MENKSFFITIPHVIYADTKLSAQAKFILAEILSLLKVDRRWCWATNRHFAQMFNLEESNVSYHIQQIEKLGWIISEAVKSCNLEYCQLKKHGWHRHIKAGVPLSKILDTLSSPTREPIKSDSRAIKSVGTISNTVNKTSNIDTIVSTAKAERKGFGNKDIDEIIDQFDKTIGHIPADKNPRNVAQHVRQMIEKFIRDNNENYKATKGNALLFPYVLTQAFLWYKQKDYCDNTEKLETFKLKLRVFLDLQQKKLLEERRKKYDINQDIERTGIEVQLPTS